MHSPFTRNKLAVIFNQNGKHLKVLSYLILHLLRKDKNMEDDDQENTFKILVATDNHIGYLETDPIRGQDSFNTFEEILKIATREKVDFILLGGDLFHHNRPSRNCLHQTMKLMRQYCFGARESKVWIASDQSVNFNNGFYTANYLDPNLNISLPIFSIHGNHDDPSGVGNLSALNVLSMAGMVNYFGQSPSIQDVVVQPILMQKGTSKVALYGLGNIREERLHRQWRSGRVKLMRPQGPQDESQEDWRECFNMFVFHQNRARHGPTSSIPEEFLDSFLDLIIWGHEHECRIIPEEYESFSITQPGSSVATSLSAGEAEPKHVGLLTINGSDYSLDKIKLGTIRPFQFTTVVLSRVEDLSPNDGKATHRYLEGVVNDLIQRAKDEWEIEHQELVDDGNSNMPTPLVRVRVDYSGGYDTFNPQQFGQKFVNRVANPSDILKFQRDRSTTQRQPRASEMMRDPTMAIPEQLDAIRVEDLAHELLADLYVVPEPGLKDAISVLVDKDDKDVLKRFIKNCEKEASVSMVQSRESLQGRDISAEYVKERAQEYKRNWISQYNQTNGVRDTQSSLSTSTPTTATNNTRRNTSNNNNNNNNNNNTTNRRRTRNNSITSVSSELSQVQPMLSHQGSTSPPLFDDDVLLLDASPSPTAPNETSRSTTTQAPGGKRRRVLPGSSTRKR